MLVNTNIVSEQSALQEELSNWLRDRFPDLDEAQIFSRQHSEIEERVRAIETGSSSAQERADLFRLRIAAEFGSSAPSEEILSKQRQAFDQLLDMAQDESSDGSVARSVLNKIIITCVAPVLPELNQWAVERTFMQVYKLCGAPEFRNLFSSSLLLALAHGYNLSHNIRNCVLDSFNLLSLRDYFPGPSLEVLARHLCMALELEIEQTSQKTSDYSILLRLIELSSTLPASNTFPALLALSQRHPDETVRQKADKALYDLENSTLKVWEQTTPDCVSNDQIRAKIITTTLNLQLSLQDKMHDITAVVKQNPVDDWQNPMADVLLNMLSNESAPLRLLAARALVQKHDANIITTEPNKILSVAIYTLSKLSFDTHAPAAKEAAMLLDTLETCSEEVRSLVGDAKTRASLDFVQQQTNSAQ